MSVEVDCDQSYKLHQLQAASHTPQATTSYNFQVTSYHLQRKTDSHAAGDATLPSSRPLAMHAGERQQAGRPQDKVNDLYTVLDAPRRRLMQYANLLRECGELMPNSHPAKLDLLELQRRVVEASLCISRV